MSKWVNKEKFDKFQSQKTEEKDTPKTGGVRRSEFVWKTPEKGTDSRAKVYEGRFVPDKDGNFYKKYYYHMFKSGEKWAFILCAKTHDFDSFCPLCTVTSKLYMGVAADKAMAGNFKRKEKFVGNFYIIDDPRDAELEDDKKVAGNVRLYEFPGKVEMKLKEEITDTRNGLGHSIFDPSDEGYNFILKVLSTKKDSRGNIWPDYSQSTFARRSSAIGTEAEIDKIMETTVSLDEYIEGLGKDDEYITQILKDEMVYEIVEDDITKNKAKEDRIAKITGGLTGKSDDIDEPDWDTPDTPTQDDTDTPVSEGSESAMSTDDGDILDEALLKELENM